ncbi:hypothetical protein AMJ80_01555, partial [bacterium SM23_31]
MKKSGDIFDIDEKIKQIKLLEKKSSEDSFWSNQEEAQNTLRSLSHLKETVAGFEKINNEISDLQELLSFAVIDNDVHSLHEIEKELPQLEKKVTGIEFEIMLDEEDDDKNAIMTIHPGAGGTESQDWAGMLLRMYLRWLETRKFTVN